MKPKISKISWIPQEPTFKTAHGPERGPEEIIVPQAMSDSSETIPSDTLRFQDT